MTREELINSIHRGANNANKTYSEWSGGSWVTDYAIEGFLVAEICRSIRRVRPTGYITMEEPFSVMQECSGRLVCGRRPRVMEGARRVDIALWNQREYITHVIEVKRYWNQESPRDLKRLFELQRKLETIQCGLFAMLVVTEGDTQDLYKAFDQQVEKIGNVIPTDKWRVHYGSDACTPFREGDWIGSSLCIEIYGQH